MTTVETADGPVVEAQPATSVVPVEAPPEMPTMEPTLVHTEDGDLFDFTSNAKPIKFRIDSDIFTAIRELPALSAMEFGQYATTLDTTTDLDEQAEAIKRMFRLVLVGDDAEKFIGRMSDINNPIGAKQMNSIMMWLMEKYGFRPTAPSEESSDGS